MVEDQQVVMMRPRWKTWKAKAGIQQLEAVLAPASMRQEVTSEKKANKVERVAEMVVERR